MVVAQQAEPEIDMQDKRMNYGQSSNHCFVMRRVSRGGMGGKATTALSFLSQIAWNAR